MREKGAAQALLRERLPRATVRRFEGPPVAVPETFVDQALRASVTDLLLRQRLRGGDEAFVYCLVEHKRTDAATVMPQLLRYLSAIYERLARTHRDGAIPPVVPIVVYNGVKRWRGPRRFSDVLDATPELKRLTVDFGVVLLDIGAEPLDRLSANRTLQGGLLGLRVAAAPPAKQAAVVVRAVEALGDDPSTVALFLRYFQTVAPRAAVKAMKRAMRQQTGKERTMQSIADYLESKGYRRGERKGLARGLARGREETLRKVVHQVLLTRFKKVPPSAQAKLANADAATLEGWHQKALTCESVAAVFAED